jgi:hypothetical protein
VRFRRSITRGPLRVTIGRSGVSVSVGIGPLRISRGADGVWRRTIRVAPGVWDTKRIRRE